MKHLCCSKILFFLFLFAHTLYGMPEIPKSAVFIKTDNISYPMVGIHDYIILLPKKTNIHRHGFKLYKEKIYAYVPSKDATKKSLTNLLNQGYKNFYIEERSATKESIRHLLSLLYTLKSKHAHILLSAPYKTLQASKDFFDGIVLYNALSLPQKKRNRYHELTNTIIDIETIDTDELFHNTKTTQILRSIEKEGMIPYICDTSFSYYGISSKNPIHREILTVIDEKKVDRIVSSAHQYGAMPLEYMGYIQHLTDISNLPDISHVKNRYGGVVIWLSAALDDPNILFPWIMEAIKNNIKVAFVTNFGFIAESSLLAQLGIASYDSDEKSKKTILYKDKMIGFEADPQLNATTLFIDPLTPRKKLLSYKDDKGLVCTPVALMPWGGYAVFGNALFEFDDNNLWIVDPFAFFKQALMLPDIPVVDVTTQNGNRLLFTHVDGDGLLNRFEGDPYLLAGDKLYSEILTRYKIPHSISVIGAEIMPNGLYPKLSPRLMDVARRFYTLPYVEPATHTFTHAFFWGKIKNGNLDPKYRLDPPGYTFSLSYELKGMLDFINGHLISNKTPKKAKTVFWSGDCAPRIDALSFVYEHNILNINGGYTTITNANPWVTLVSPIGLERGGYYQIYTGAQNENIYTNEWTGPFWGFKNVVQTFKLTDKPRRLKPIDIYYHIYSGSKVASINALKYVFNWALKQETLPIFTSEYIPKAMDFYEVSIAKTGNDRFYISGMKNVKTIRVSKNEHVDMPHSPSTMGEKTINDQTYIALDPHSDHLLQLHAKKPKRSYLISANGDVTEYIRGKYATRYKINAYVDITTTLHMPKECTCKTKPTFAKKVQKNADTTLYFHSKKVTIDVICKR